MDMGVALSMFATEGFIWWKLNMICEHNTE